MLNHVKGTRHQSSKGNNYVESNKVAKKFIFLFDHEQQDLEKLSL